MPLLQVRDFPKELYDTISQAAKTESGLQSDRSISQQTIVLLKNALQITGERRARRRAVFNEIDNLHIANAQSFPDPAELTREDRDR
ncbi:hypothetical protein AGMMS49991_08970 [Spirochaetia bacterium]|nr:hypothetical protein AGMMS49991_08970 [Spirochaetia bacterium]